ncbi:MAG: hypothetical protein ABFQ82_00825 [Thermodesulfobacteriota bacterium]
MALVLLFAANVNAGDLQVITEEISGNTFITCLPFGEREIERAYITIYDCSTSRVSARKREMEVSYDNEATYTLPGVHQGIEGTCKVIMAGGHNKISRTGFSISNN